ncbi:MAG: sigma 54-interacting transcriptional regulator [Planctomycetota bacterium]
MLGRAEVALASTRGTDAKLEATLTLGRLAAALREPRAPGLLLAAVDAAEELGRPELGRAAVLELGRCLVRGGEVVLGRGHLERALGEAQRAEDPLVPGHVAAAALGLVEAWLQEGDPARAQAAQALAPRESPQAALAAGLVAAARGQGDRAREALARAAAGAAAFRDPIAAATFAHELRLAQGALERPALTDRLRALPAEAAREALAAILAVCEAPAGDPWPVAADALRRLSGAAAAEVEVAGRAVASPPQADLEGAREVARGELILRLQGAAGGELPELLTELLLAVCARLGTRAGDSSARVLQMLDRLVESDLEGAQLLELATQLAVEATGAARGRLIRLPASGEVGWTGGPEASFVSRSLLRHVVLTGRPLLLEDASEAPPLAVGESVGAKGLRSVVAAPLLGRRGQVLGVLYLDDPGAAGRFGPGELAVVAGFAARLGPQLESELRARLREGGGGATAELVPRGLIEGVSGAEAPLLICGEGGVGKEHFARAVHAASPRREGPFVVLSCSTVADELLESELFGHEQGAFTGAHARRDGFFQRAAGGILFLDGLQEASPRLQAELLRAVETHEVRRLGGEVERVNVRVLAAFQGDPAAGVSAGRLRQDLYYRLSVLRVDLPPLRERRAEVPALARALLARLGEPDRELTPGALERLTAHPWPGNLRELQACLERALLEAGGDALRARHLRLELPAPRGVDAALRLNPRQLQALSALRPGQVLRTGDYMTQWGVSPATAWRDLSGLVKAGLLEGDGKGRGALYRLPPGARG